MTTAHEQLQPPCPHCSERNWSLQLRNAENSHLAVVHTDTSGTACLPHARVGTRVPLRRALYFTPDGPFWARINLYISYQSSPLKDAPPPLTLIFTVYYSEYLPFPPGVAVATVTAKVMVDLLLLFGGYAMVFLVSPKRNAATGTPGSLARSTGRSYSQVPLCP